MCVHIFSMAVIRSDGHGQSREDQMNGTYRPGVNEHITDKEAQAPKAVPACCTPAPLETPAGLKLNTHLAHITSYPSKIFHYHSIKDIKGTVIAKTLQD